MSDERGLFQCPLCRRRLSTIYRQEDHCDLEICFECFLDYWETTTMFHVPQWRFNRYVLEQHELRERGSARG